jgi:hypothetical protein
MFSIKYILSACALTALVACGGGGSSGGSGLPANSGIPPASAATPLSNANFGSVAGASAGSILAAAGVGNGLDSLSSASRDNALRPLSSSPYDWALWAIGAARPTLEQAQASQTGNQACPAGGSLSFTFNDNDNNGDVSSGDSISFIANNCIAAAGELPINGSFAIAVTNIAYSAAGDLIAASLTMSFTNFSSAGNTLNGSVSVSLANNTATTSYTNFTSTRGSSSSAILNYTTVVNTISGQLSINGLITINNNTYTLSTPSPIVFGGAYPTGGLLRVTDAAGGRIDIISTPAAGGTLACDLYLPGDQIRDGQILSAWSAL